MSETMRVEVTEKKLKDSGYGLVEGDTVTVPFDVGERWCGHGWAKDSSGKVPTGERIVNRAAVATPKRAVSDLNERR